MKKLDEGSEASGIVDRRRMLMHSALGILASLNVKSSAAAGIAAVGTDEVKNNIAMVADYISAYNDPKRDVDRIMSYIADTLIFKETFASGFHYFKTRDEIRAFYGKGAAQPPVKGRQHVYGQIVDVWAVGPIVVHHREKSLFVPEPSGVTPTPIVAVWAFREGKIAQILGYPASRQREY